MADPGHIQVIVIAGPTASGKTALAIELAEKLNCEILSADSRQFYAELKIGVARPTEEELKRVKHHFIADRSIQDFITAGQYADEAREKIRELTKDFDHVVVAGGSGLHLKALLEGIDDSPMVTSGLRDEIQRQYLSEGLESIGQSLREIDPNPIEGFEWDNPRRVMRVLEIVKSSGKSYAESFSPAKALEWPVKAYALEWPREELYERINARVEQMMQDGLLAEVESLLEYKDLDALRTVGYSELFDYLDGKYSLERAVELIQQNSRRYAKRQITWFKNQGNFQALQKESSIEEIIPSL
jgi:tRNA dimethylallyltransferase